jgi:hypothetical protein
MVRDGLPYTLYYDLGSQDSAAFNVDPTGALKLTYTADKGEFKRYCFNVFHTLIRLT